MAFFGKAAGGGEARLTWERSSWWRGGRGEIEGKRRKVEVGVEGGVGREVGVREIVGGAEVGRGGQVGESERN